MIAFPATLTADNSEAKILYESRRLQLEFLLQQSSIDTQSIALILEEAKYFAEEGEYQVALDLLESAMDDLSSQMMGNEQDSTEFSDLMDVFQPGPERGKHGSGNWNISAEIGSDYSRNEYELSFLESDSLVLEEINNPFLALRVSRSESRGERWVNFYNYTRADREIFQTTFALALESIGYRQNWRLEGRTNAYWFPDQARGTFWENEIHLNWNHLLNQNKRVYIQTDLRSKLYLPDNETYRNLFDGDLRLALRHNFQVLHWLDFSITPSRYVEFSEEGMGYYQLHNRVEYHNRSDYNQYVIARLNHYYREFRTSTLTENYANTYNSFRPTLAFELPLLKTLGIAGQLDLDVRKFMTPDPTYSDYNYHWMNLMIKHYFSVYNAIGIGYVREQENHHTANSGDLSVVNLEDFYSNGFSLSMDILHFKGIMISFGYSYVLRTYPNSSGQDLLSLYTNRRIHTVQGFGFLPFSSHWQLQFFISYDNDQDRQLDSNDNLSTLFNLSLLYQF